MQTNKENKENGNKQMDQSYGAYVKRQFRKNKRALYSAYLIFFMAIIALFADFIANEKPYYCKLEGKTYFPIFQQIGSNLGLTKMSPELIKIDWLNQEFDYAIYPPIPYSYTTQDLDNAQFVAPFGNQDIRSPRWRHWCGTTRLGRDVTAGLIHGTRIAFLVGIISMSIATFIGIFLGSLAGFYGDDRFKMSRASLFIGLAFLGLAFFYAFSSRSYILGNALSNSFVSFAGQLILSLGIFGGIMFFSRLVAIPFKKIKWLGQKIAVPLDLFISRLIEVMVSIPKLFLIIAIVAIAKPSIFLVMVIIGMTSWTGIARFIRAELLRVRSLEYIEAADALGFSNYRTLVKHAIPNALSPVLIAIAFGIAAAVLIESFLSFLGIGVPPELLTWGKLLGLGRGLTKEWWMVIYPGFAIFLTVTLFNLIGEGLTDALDPKLKQ